MSWKASAYVKELVFAPNGERLTRSEKLLLLVLADYHDERLNEAWPSVKSWAEDAMMSEQRLKELRTGLIRKGVITSSPVQNSDGTWGSNRYTFTGLTTRREVAPTRRAAYEPPVEQPTQSRQLTVKEPPKEPSLREKAKKSIRDVDDSWLNEQVSTFPNIDVFEEAEGWRDWVAANGRIYKDWQAGCRTWLRKANNERRGQGVRANPGNGGFESSGIRTSGFHDGTGFVLDP